MSERKFRFIYGNMEVRRIGDLGDFAWNHYDDPAQGYEGGFTVRVEEPGWYKFSVLPNQDVRLSWWKRLANLLKL